ncbi:MAG TPA: DUF1328 domain-containing protein [Balneolaceae bacterium]
MLKWSAIFLIIAVIAAVFGFGGLQDTAGLVFQILFYIFIALFVISLVRDKMINPSD